MFKRQKPRNAFEVTREFIWPSIGWWRSFKYLKYRLVRLSDSSQKIALGMACGMAVSFTPFVGTHWIQAGFVTYIMRGNLLAAFIGTFIGNPWTFPFLWWIAIRFGSFLFGLLGLPASTVLPAHVDLYVLWDIATTEPLRILLPWILGSYLLALMTWPFFYIITVHLIRAAKEARRQARLRRLHQVAREVTGQKD